MFARLRIASAEQGQQTAIELITMEYEIKLRISSGTLKKATASR